jgi:hypothetical protein
LGHEHRNNLEDQGNHNKEEDQNAVHLVLETLLRVVGHEERETD